MILQPGDILLDKYRIERLLGQGAFAQVYLATHLQLRAPRALKVLRRDAPGLGSTEFHDYRQRFELEAQLGAALDHPHLIRVHDFEQEGEALILVMEYAAGGSLAERIAAARQEGRPLPVDECVRVAREVAEGLAVLHGRDIVHRDLKPSNVLFDGQGRAKVADLGLAQVPGSPTRPSLLGSQARPQPGTPDYMSPEQVANAPRLMSPSDVYALGAVLFEMLTGRLYRNARPGTRVRELRPEVPKWLDALVARMVAEEPGARPWDGAEVAQALAEGERQRIEAEKRIAEEERARREREKCRQRLVRWLKWGLVGVAVLLLVLWGVTRLVCTPRERAEKHYQSGLAAARAGNYAEAIADYSKAIELDPTRADFYYSRGISYHEKRDYDRAIADYSKAIELEPNNPQYWYSRSLTYRAKGDTARADADLAKARALGYKE